MDAYVLSTILILYTFNYTLSSKVTWLPSSSFNIPQNFRYGKLPCSKQTVIIPDNVVNSIEIDSDISMSELILSGDCDLFLQNAEIAFGPANDNCTEGGYTYYMQKSPTSWAQPDVWSSPRFNEATPDAERVPCFDDVVEFPADSQFAVLLPEKIQTIRELRIGNTSVTNVASLYYNYMYTTDGVQQFILNSDYEEGLDFQAKTCTAVSGCPCQKEVLGIDCASKYCEKPTCVNPVKPIGHCCKICGGAIVFDTDESFDFLLFTESVEDVIASYGKENLVYHIGKLTSNRVQVVVVDRGTYSGTSAVVVNAISHLKEKHEMSIYETLMSGSPLDESGAGGIIFISVFFVVIIALASIYVYYYKLPEVIFPTTRPGILRFNQRTESVVSLTRRDSGVGFSGGATRASFRNPLYDSKKERVIVEESVIED